MLEKETGPRVADAVRGPGWLALIRGSGSQREAITHREHRPATTSKFAVDAIHNNQNLPHVLRPGKKRDRPEHRFFFN
jgi:hypothetical protein